MPGPPTRYLTTAVLGSAALICRTHMWDTAFERPRRGPADTDTMDNLEAKRVLEAARLAREQGIDELDAIMAAAHG